MDSVTLDYRTLLNGTASDFDTRYASTSSSNNGTVTFAPGETNATISIRADSDTTDEPDEAITLELSNLSENADFANGEAVTRVFGTILDNDGDGSNLSVFVSDPVIVEGDNGAREAVFDIVLSREVNDSFSLSYYTVDGSAQAGSDYTATNGSATFLPGQTSTQISVPITTDTVAETSEYFSLVVSPPLSPQFDTTGAVGNAHILDDDSGAGAVVSIEGSATQESYNNYVRFTVTLSEPPVDAVSMDYRVLLSDSAGNDDLRYYSTSTSNNDTLTFAPGQTTASVFVRLDSDSIDERDGAFTLELTNLSENATFAGGGNSLSALGFSLDNDGVGANAILEVLDPVLTEGDGGIQYAVFEIQLSRPATTAFTVDYETADITAFAGSDYVATSGTLTFEEGQDRAAVRVRVLGDTLSEATESFALNLSTSPNVSLGTAGLSGEATLIDNDSGSGLLPVLSITDTVNTNESYNGYLRYVVTLSEPSDEPVTVDYTTVLGSALDSDLYYTSSSSSNNGSLTFQPGETSHSIYLRADSDSLDERDESVLIRLENPAGAVLAGGVSSLTAAAFIQDNDGLGLNIAAVGQPARIDEPASGAVTVAVPLTLSQAPDEELVFNVYVTGGTASQGQDFSLVSSQVVFAAGQTSSAVRLTVSSDFADEAPETVILNYQPVAGSEFAGTIPEHILTLGNFTQATELDDSIRGSVGNDSIDGLAGNDWILGEDGNDTLRGGNGVDTISGGSGDDFIFGGGDAADLRDVIYAGAGNDSADGGYGNDELRGDAGNDTLVGGFGADTIIGGDGNDVLTGQAWSDAIFGGNGNDFINGGFGFDRVNGGAGADQFYHLGADGHGSDWIQDYSAAEGDRLVYGGGAATADDFLVQRATTPGAGAAGVQEVFITHIPSGDLLWALVDGDAQGALMVTANGVSFDLLA
ncbi:putative calcium-binding protein [Salipiger abyssi]|uniref:Putative calcium-binding protein n=1 Tax=Salipiger abyssi TaxID=1250539 RepID=A0A1P8UXR4_9RHOB|nr:Calx-beta domain-containing protein [Salipiger abyssi]APZ54167.1 putative calcium-binding protein [Salipiger abyssi]